MANTKEAVAAARARVEAKRAAVEAARIDEAAEIDERAAQIQIAALNTEEQRLDAELAALNSIAANPQAEAEERGEYVVPLGTVAVATDVIEVKGDEATVPAGVTPETAAVPFEDLKLSQLKALAAERELPTSGTKEELIALLSQNPSGGDADATKENN